MTRKVIFALVILMFCCYTIGWGQETFVVLGKIERGESDVHPTLEMAVKEGLKEAVEEAVWRMIPLNTMNEKYTLLTENVFNRARSFILSYKILEETSLTTGYQVLLEVVVDTNGIKKRLESLGLFQKGDERPLLRVVKLVLAGIKTYDVYQKVEEFLRDNSEVQTFALSEIEPTKFTWKLSIKGEIGDLANQLLHQKFDGLMVKVVKSTAEELEVELLTQDSSQQREVYDEETAGINRTHRYWGNLGDLCGVYPSFDLHV
jgi:hypothetical protein